MEDQMIELAHRRLHEVGAIPKECDDKLYDKVQQILRDLVEAVKAQQRHELKS